MNPKGGWITSYQLLWPWFRYIFIVFLLRVFMWFPSMGWNSNFSNHISELMSHKHPQALFLDGVQASTKLIRFTYQFSLNSLENVPPGFLISYLMGNTSRMTYRHRSKLSTRMAGPENGIDESLAPSLHTALPSGSTIAVNMRRWVATPTMTPKATNNRAQGRCRVHVTSYNTLME